MKIFIQHQATLTPGAVDGLGDFNSIIRRKIEITNEMRHDVGGIQSYEEFLIKYESKKYFKRWVDFLENIKNKLIQENYINIDPVEFLLYYYSIFGKGYSFHSLYQEFGQYCENGHRDTFTHFFSKILGWDSRYSDEITFHTRQKLKNRYQKANIDAKQQTQETVNNVIAILEGKKIQTEEKEFDYNEYKKCKNATQKTAFILEYLGIIKKDDFENEIILLREKFSLKVTQKAIQKILDSTNEKIPKIKFNNGRISEILKKHNSSTN